MTISQPFPGWGTTLIRAAESLRIAAVLMCSEVAATDDYIALAREAARSLVVLALADERDALRELLTPDPQVPQVTYTVSCHATGGVVAAHIRDFSDPIAAVCALVHCTDQAHEFAELVASSRTGIRRSVLQRAGRDIQYLLPSPQTITGPPRAQSQLGAARRRWRAHLAAWSMAQDAIPSDDNDAKRAADSATEVAVPISHNAGSAELAARVASLEATVELLAAQVRDMGVGQRGADVFAQLLDSPDDAFWSSELVPGDRVPNEWSS